MCLRSDKFAELNVTDDYKSEYLAFIDGPGEATCHAAKIKLAVKNISRSAAPCSQCSVDIEENLSENCCCKAYHHFLMHGAGW